MTERALVAVGVVSAVRLEVGDGGPGVIRVGVVEKRIDDGRAGAAAENSGDEQ